MSEKSYYEQTDAQFKIRLPHELKDKIRASAEQHNRTMTADIVARLENSFQQVRDTQATQDEILQAIADAKTEITAELKAEIQSLKR